MAGKKGLKKRVWSDDEKRTICAQTLTEGVSVAQVARRYSMNANLIFKWLKDPRFAAVESGASAAEAVVESIFLPVEIEAPPLESGGSALAQEVVLVFRPFCSPVKVDHCFVSGC